MLKENDYWQTPQYILDKVNEFWPGGWFVPCPVNHSTTLARTALDGRFNKWPARCYINPPFSQYLKWASHGRLQLDCARQVNEFVERKAYEAMRASA